MDRVWRLNFNVLRLVFPAHAGMDRATGNDSASLPKCSPHTRGWTGKGAEICRGNVSCSPHTRGWTAAETLALAMTQGVPRTRGDGPRYQRAPYGSQEVFPAHAGMDRISTPSDIGESGCSPHTRGWTVVLGQGACLLVSVPRTRGDGPAKVRDWLGNDGVFPAHAGMDRSTSPVAPQPTACSPHTRGWTSSSFPSMAAEPVFPAHAGMDRLVSNP